MREGHDKVLPSQQLDIVGPQQLGAVGLKHRCSKSALWFPASGNHGDVDATQQSEKQLHQVNFCSGRGQRIRPRLVGDFLALPRDFLSACLGTTLFVVFSCQFTVLILCCIACCKWSIILTRMYLTGWPLWKAVKCRGIWQLLGNWPECR